MKKSNLIKRTLLLLLAVVSIIYWKPLLHLMAWLVIFYWMLRFAFRVLKLFAPVLILFTVLYILFKY